MSHPPLVGTGDPGNFASKTAANNIAYPIIETLNLLLSARFNGMTINVTGCLAYSQNATEDLTSTSIPVAAALADESFNASPMAFEGNFTGGGFTGPYLIAPAYRALLVALDSGEEAQLEAWYTKYFTGSEANWANFRNSLGIDQAVLQATKAAILAAASGLPVI
jgi:hypothetical protein